MLSDAEAGSQGTKMFCASASKPVAIDQRGDVRSAKTIIDVDDCNVRRAGVEHAEESGNASERGSVTDTGRHRNDGSRNEAADNRRQRAFHARADDQDGGALQLRALREQAVQTGDAYIGDKLDGVPHQFGGDACLFGDREIARSCTNDGYRSGCEWRGTLAECDASAKGVKYSFGGSCASGLELFLGGARGQNAYT